MFNQNKENTYFTSNLSKSAKKAQNSGGNDFATNPARFRRLETQQYNTPDF